MSKELESQLLLVLILEIFTLKLSSCPPLFRCCAFCLLALSDRVMSQADSCCKQRQLLWSVPEGLGTARRTRSAAAAPSRSCSWAMWRTGAQRPSRARRPPPTWPPSWRVQPSCRTQSSSRAWSVWRAGASPTARSRCGRPKPGAQVSQNICAGDGLSAGRASAHIFTAWEWAFVPREERADKPCQRCMQGLTCGGKHRWRSTHWGFAACTARGLAATRQHVSCRLCCDVFRAWAQTGE